MRKCLILMGMIFLTEAVPAQDVKKIKADELEKFILESKGPLIVNMWATWCKPCIEELPYFLEEAKKHQKDSVQLILVSLDFKETYPQKVIAFAKKKDITVPIRWLDETDADYFCPKVDPKWSGAIPATLFINNKTGYRHFVEEQLSHERLKLEIMAILK